MKLDRDKRYGVTRVGEDTARCAEGDSFNISWSLNRWVIRDGANTLYSAQEGTFQNTKFWTIDYCFDEDDLQGQQEKEYNMSFDKVKTETMKVETGVTLVNDQRLDKFSDDAIISMVTAERAKLATLEADVGTGSKYCEAKRKLVDANVKVLLDELDKRVA